MNSDHLTTSVVVLIIAGAIGLAVQFAIIKGAVAAGIRAALKKDLLQPPPQRPSSPDDGPADPKERWPWQGR